MFPQIEPYQSRIICMTSGLFYGPFLYTIYRRRRNVLQDYLNRKRIGSVEGDQMFPSHPIPSHPIPSQNITVGQWLGIVSFISGTCSIIYWQNPRHDSMRYYIDLSTAKITGVVYFFAGYKYVIGKYRRNIGYGLLTAIIISYHMSNTWYSLGQDQWYLWHMVMHFVTNVNCIHILNCVYDHHL